MKIDQKVLSVLDAARLDGDKLFLEGQLDRKLYTEVAKVLETAGGKWNRKAKAHVFDGGAAEALEPLLLTGEFTRAKQDFGQFDTPLDLVEMLIDSAKVEAGMTALEPSVGVGNIAFALLKRGVDVTAYEIDPKRFAKLRQTILGGAKGVIQAFNVDFLTEEPRAVYDRVVMNPPFSRQVDIDHVMHAAKFLKPGGRLAAIMSAGVLFRDNRKTLDFRAFVSTRGGLIHRLPDNSFKSSGTDVNTALVVFDAP